MCGVYECCGLILLFFECSLFSVEMYVFVDVVMIFGLVLMLLMICLFFDSWMVILFCVCVLVVIVFIEYSSSLDLLLILFLIVLNVVLIGLLLCVLLVIFLFLIVNMIFVCGCLFVFECCDSDMNLKCFCFCVSVDFLDMIVMMFLLKIFVLWLVRFLKCMNVVFNFVLLLSDMLSFCRCCLNVLWFDNLLSMILFVV